ncbi:hypothetical protein GCM10009682_10120 [Luedemannella flava]|uniref:Uncharacterized protein n=1 Tax=Luedemannella flava TaxID=349316 RepID=A0ABP4XRW6_9ACTN
MARREDGSKLVLRGVLISVVTVAILVLLAAFHTAVFDAVAGAWNFVVDRIPDDGAQRTAVLVYLIVSVLIGIIFSRAGHFTAYGVAMGLIPLLWVLFWEGFPPLGLNPGWTDSLGVGHIGPGIVSTWAFVAVILMTLVFVPLELWEKARRRGRARNDD